MSTIGKSVSGAGSSRERTSDKRDVGPMEIGAAKRMATEPEATPAAGAHAARHLVNEELTPGAGALPSYAHAAGREVDGGAG